MATSVAHDEGRRGAGTGAAADTCPAYPRGPGRRQASCESARDALIHSSSAAEVALSASRLHDCTSCAPPPPRPRPVQEKRNPMPPRRTSAVLVAVALASGAGGA